MSKKIIMISILLIEVSIVNATDYTKIKSITDSNLVDGGYYTLVYDKHSTIFDGPNGYPTTKREKTQKAALANSDILKLVYVNHHWHFIDLKRGKYICDSTSCMLHKFFILSSRPEDNSIVTFKNQKYKYKYYPAIRIGIRDLYCEDEGHDFGFLRERNKTCTNYSIYRITGFEKIDDDHPLYPTNNDTRICYKRNFDPTMKNTFIFPFDIPDFSLKFGRNIIAYQPSKKQEKDEEILFSKITNDTLKANTPYLLKGKFYKEGALLDCPSAFSIPTSNKNIYILSDGITFHGVYDNHTDIAKQKNLILYKDQLYFTDQVSTMHIGPYRWYITLPDGSTAGSKFNIVIHQENNGGSTSIGTGLEKIKPSDSMKQTVPYNLYGQRTSPGYKGIVIKNGKKYITK